MKQKCLQCIKVISADSRFKILNFILQSKDPLPFSDLVKNLGLSQPTITFHIEKLVESGLIKKIKKGKSILLVANISCVECPLH